MKVPPIPSGKTRSAPRGAAALCLASARKVPLLAPERGRKSQDFSRCFPEVEAYFLLSAKGLLS